MPHAMSAAFQQHRNVEMLENCFPRNIFFRAVSDTRGDWTFVSRRPDLISASLRSLMSCESLLAVMERVLRKLLPRWPKEET